MIDNKENETSCSILRYLSSKDKLQKEVLKEVISSKGARLIALNVIFKDPSRGGLKDTVKSMRAYKKALSNYITRRNEIYREIRNYYMKLGGQNRRFQRVVKSLEKKLIEVNTGCINRKRYNTPVSFFFWYKHLRLAQITVSDLLNVYRQETSGNPNSKVLENLLASEEFQDIEELLAFSIPDEELYTKWHYSFKPDEIIEFKPEELEGHRSRNKLWYK